MSARSKHKVISFDAVQYECGICLREFSTSWCLQMHIKTHSEQNSFDCHECGMTVPDFSALCEHLKVHIFGADPVEEDTVTPSVSDHDDPVSLTEGDQISRISKPHLTCVTCDKSFETFKALKLHSRIHKTKKVIQIKQGGNLSADKTRGATSFESHQGGSQIVKAKRGRPKKNKNKAQAHFVKVGKKYRCEVCANKLSSRYLMEKHIQKHQTVQFHCSQCDRSFLTRSDLKDHEKVHDTAEKHPIPHETAEKPPIPHDTAEKHPIPHETAENHPIPHETAEKHPIPHEVVVEDHVKAVELVMEDEKGFSCIVCEKTFNSKQKAHVHILCHKKRKRRHKLKTSKKQLSNTMNVTSPRRQYVSDLQENAGVGASHMTPVPASSSLSFCCGECKEQFGTQDELVHHQNLHIRDHTMALMRILKPGTNLNVSIAETQTLLNAVHSASDFLQTTNNEATFRNTSNQEQASPVIHHPENCQPGKATIESSSRKHLLKAFPNVQCNVKVVLERLENEALLVQNGSVTVSRHSKKHRNKRDNSVQQRKSGENTEWADRVMNSISPKKLQLDRTEDTVWGTGVGHATEETMSDSDAVMQEAEDFSDDDDNDTFHDEDDIEHVENDLYSVSAKDSTDFVNQDATTAEDKQKTTSAESPRTSENVNNSVLTKDLVPTEETSKGNTAKLSSLAKSILENVVKKGEMFSCKICGGEFPELQKAKNHVRVHVSKKRFECNSCPAKFAYASKLLAHQATHMSHNLSKEKRTRLTTRCHYRIVGKEFICNICDKTFMTKQKVQGHVRYHLLEDTYHCRFCDKCFRLKHSLYHHEKTHPEASAEASKNTSIEDRHAEDGEPKEVTLKFKRGKYKEYMEVEDDILKCKLCGSTFRSNKQIIDHFRSHFAERKFFCQICSASFKRNTHLDVHMKAHARGNVKMPEMRISEGVKDCMNVAKEKDVKIREPKAVMLKFRRGKYKEYIEAEDGNLKCKLCASTFKNNKQIIDHFRSHFAERKFWCTICSAAFKRNTHLDVHMKAHARGNVKMPKMRISDGVNDCINALKKYDVKMNQENKKENDVELSADVSIHTQSIEDRGEAENCDLPELPQPDTLDNVPVNANKEQQASVVTLPQDDWSSSNAAGDNLSTADNNLRSSTCSHPPSSIASEIIKRPPLSEADGASVGCRSSDEEGHLLAEHTESTGTSAEVPREKETLSHTEREMPDDGSAVTVNFNDGEDGDGEQKAETLSHTEREMPDDGSAVTINFNDGEDGDGEQKAMTQAVAAPSTACVKDGTETDPQIHTGPDPDPDSITVHGHGESENPDRSGESEILPAASDDGQDDYEDDDDCMIDVDDASDDNDCDSDFKYESDMDSDSDISNEDISSVRNGKPTVKYLYDSPADDIADESETMEPNSSLCSGSENQASPSRNKQDAIQPELCSPKKKRSKYSNKPAQRDKSTASRERGRRVITQDKDIKMTQYVSPLENLKKKIIKGQGQDGHSDLHEDESHECHVGPKTAETEECSLMESASSEGSFSPQMDQTEYTIEVGGSFRCAFCDKVFKSLLSIRNHLSVEHDLFRCKTCIATFQTHQELIKHNEENKHLQLRVLSNRNIESKMEIVEGMFKCNLCQKTFLEKEKCALHVRHHLTAFKYICDICSQACKSRSVLAIHMSRHSNSCIFECKVCLQKYPNMGSLRYHEKSHSEEEKINILNYVKCETCGDLCFNRKMLERHSLQHKDNHTCDFCKVSFPTHSALLNHQSLEQHYKCEHCGKTYKDQKYLRKHIQSVHIKPDTHMCDKCGKTLSSLAGLRAHMTLHSGTSKYQCSICKLKFQHAGKLAHHMKAHEAGGGLCELCNKFIRNKIGLDVHKIMHQALEAAGVDLGNPKGLLIREQLEYTCPCCKKTIGTVDQLQQHIKHHFVERRFKCPMCDMAFYNNYYLETHIRIHNKDFRFQCDQCPRKFASSNFLNNHIKKFHLKTDRGRFPCDICKKIFRTKEGVASHKKLHKDRVRSHPCDQCSMSFFSSSELKAHKQSHSTERAFMCDLCGVSYKTKYMLRDHMLRHEGRKDFKCDLCGKEFYLKAYLQIHLRNHKNERNFKCDFCGKGFNHPNSLNDHRRIHTGEKPYKCKVCDRKFTDRSARRTHQMSHKMSSKKKKDKDDL